jgi:aminopeptidase N
LNEGFATYAEWLWSEHEGLGTAQENFDLFYSLVPPDNPFWSVVIGDPGAEQIFNQAVYWRGGMTLHQLRLATGDDHFFRLLRTWARSHAGGNGTTAQFIALAERISGQNLDALFQTWLYTPTKPEVPVTTVLSASAVPAAGPAAMAMAKRLGVDTKAFRR